MTTASVISSNAPEKEKKHFQLIDRTYHSNIDSDYTEKIEALGRSFDYENNRHHYWGEPELSTLYGTPLYEVASPSQKLALNHLYWVGQYHHTAAAEANTMLYNQVTAGVFAHVSGYETLCDELDLETTQERSHVTTFQRIGYKTKVALMGKEALGNPLYKKQKEKSKGETLLARLSDPANRVSLQQLIPSQEALQDSTLRFITKLLMRNQSGYYSEYLKSKGADSIPVATGGLAGYTASTSMFKFLTLNWGSSPFMAAQYYSARMIANMSLKAYEYRYYKRFRDFEKASEFIPAPTAVSHYHLLDEAFHTTMSQVIAQEVYHDFPKPTAYEKWLANTIIYLSQRGILSGLSGGLPAVFRDDSTYMPSFYRLLTSPVFNMDKTEALQWMEKCLCHEHEGFHVNLKYHQTLLSDLRRFFDRLDYLSPVNRELQIMAAGGSIEAAIARNTKAFEQFSRSIA